MQATERRSDSPSGKQNLLEADFIVHIIKGNAESQGLGRKESGEQHDLSKEYMLFL